MLPILLAVVVLCIVGSEVAIRKGYLSAEHGRKWLHFTVVSACALAPLLIPSQGLLLTIVGVAAIAIYIALRRGWLAANHVDRKSWGILYFVLAYWLLLAIVWQHVWLIVLPMLVMATADPVAAAVGEATVWLPYRLTGDRKTIGGSLAFFTTTLLVLFGGLALPELLELPQVTYWTYRLPAALLIALLLTLLEGLPSGGGDNLTVPLGGSWLLAVLFLSPDSALLWRMWVVTGAAFVFLGAAHRVRMLSNDGAVAALLLAVVIVTAGGWWWAAPVLFFFITGSLLGRMLRSRATVTEQKHHRPRDWQQVLANGGVGGMMAMIYTFYPTHLHAKLYLVSLAVCTADTWASEIGNAIRGATYDIVTGKRMPKGLSGGISVAGTLGAAAGAAGLAVVGVAVVKSHDLTWWPIALAGFMGMLLDSLLGSRLQARYRHPDGSIVDYRPTPDASPITGYTWITNDAVNVLSVVFTTLGYLLVRQLL